MGLLVLAALAAGTRWLRADPPTDEHNRARRAAMMLNFVRYTRWPDSAFASERAPYVVTVLGDGVARHLEQLVKPEKIGGRAVGVRWLRPPPLDAPKHDWDRFGSDLDGTHALYIEFTYDKHVPKILEAADGRDILTSGDSPHLAERGGMLGLVHDAQADKYQIEANLQAIRKTRLVVNARLLQLTQIVTR
jgi:hypothetical protein